jgi:integrase
MEKEELEKLIDGMADRKYKLLTRFLVLSGLRIGELIALEKSDVDIDGRVIHVTKNRQAVTQETGLPKNSTSYRDVYMQDELASVCTEINQLIEMLGIKSKLFFPNADGDYLRHDAVSKYFRENSERILGRRVTPHMLRHTHVSLVVEASILAGTPISLDDIAERLGHANSKITKEIYYHKTNLVREAVNQKFNSIHLL